LAPEHDRATGFDYLVGRYYRSDTGRFTTADSSVFADPTAPQSWHLYTYGYNNPMMNTDPMGQSPCPPGSLAMFCTETKATVPVESDPLFGIEWDFARAHWLMQVGQEAHQSTSNGSRSTATRNCVPPAERGVEQKISDAVVGFGDAFVVPILFRNVMGWNVGIDFNSSEYRAGEIVGTVEGLLRLLWRELPRSAAQGRFHS
jgi:RHS repeat-associated protein